MRFHILGIGPVGSLLAFHLRRNLPPTHAVTLLHKKNRQATEITANDGAIRVEMNGVVLSVDGFEGEVFGVDADPNSRSAARAEASHHSGSSRAPSDTRIESLFITTKAHQTVKAVQKLLPRLSGNSTIVLLQNGLGVYEQLVQDVFRNPANRPHFILASNTHGAWAKRFQHIVHAGIGQIQFGIVPDPEGCAFEAALVEEPKQSLRLDDISKLSNDPLFTRYCSLRATVAALCSLGDLCTSWRPIAEVQEAIRRKLVVNSVINPLTALMGCRNGDIFKTAASHRIMRRVCQEASAAFAAQIQADTEACAEEGNEVLHTARMPRSLTPISLENECIRVAEATKGNISSMLVDIRRGKPTEIDYFNGYLLNLGATYRIPMPGTATLLNLVKMRSAIPLEQHQHHPTLIDIHQIAHDIPVIHFYQLHHPRSNVSCRTTRAL